MSITPNEEPFVIYQTSISLAQGQAIKNTMRTELSHDDLLSVLVNHYTTPTAPKREMFVVHD